MEIHARKLEAHPIERLVEVESLRKAIAKKQQLVNHLLIEIAYLREKLKELSDRID